MYPVGCKFTAVNLWPNYCNAVFQPSERYNILRSTAQGPQVCPIQLQALGLEAWQSLHTNHMAY